MGNGEIARNEQFLRFPQCFQKTHCRRVKTTACLGKGKFRSMESYSLPSTNRIMFEPSSSVSIRLEIDKKDRSNSGFSSLLLGLSIGD